MTLKFMDGFDLYDAHAHISRRGWVEFSGSVVFATGRFGVGQSMGTSNATIIGPGLTSGNTWAFGFAFKTDALGGFGGSGKQILCFQGASTVICGLYLTSGGSLIFGRTDSTTNKVCNSAAGVITAGAWNYIEVELTRGTGSSGAVAVYVNGTSVASLSSTNTGAAAIDTFTLMQNQDGSNMFYDDFYFCDVATKLGESRIDVLRPSGDSTVAFTPNSGANNFSRVNTTLMDDDTTYNVGITIGTKDLFDMDNMGFTPTAIRAVQTSVMARKDDAPPKQIRTNMKNGTTTTNGTTATLSTSYTVFSDIYVTDPDTSAAFTPTNVNAMQLGYEIVT